MRQTNNIEMVPIDDLRPDPDQPRSGVDEEVSPLLALWDAALGLIRQLVEITTEDLNATGEGVVRAMGRGFHVLSRIFHRQIITFLNL